MTPHRHLLDPRNLARVRTQVWFAEMALQAMKAEVVCPGEQPTVAIDRASQAEEVLGPIVRLLALAQVHLSDRIDDATVSRPEPVGQTGSGGPR